MFSRRINFNGILTRLRLFCAERLESRFHCTFIDFLLFKLAHTYMVSLFFFFLMEYNGEMNKKLCPPFFYEK